MMAMLSRLASLFALARVLRADIVVVNDLIKPEDVYDFTYSTDSDIWWRSQNATKYYCIFRSTWDKENHPFGKFMMGQGDSVEQMKSFQG